MDPSSNRNNLKRKADVFHSQSTSYDPMSRNYPHFQDNRPSYHSNTSHHTAQSSNRSFDHLGQQTTGRPIGSLPVIQLVPHAMKEHEKSVTYRQSNNQTNDQAFRSNGSAELALQATDQSKDQTINKLNAQIEDMRRCIQSKDETINRLTSDAESLRKSSITKDQTINQLSQAVNDLQSINESNEQSIKQAADRIAQLETINQTIKQQHDHLQNEVKHLNSIISSLVSQSADQTSVKLEPSDDQSINQSNNQSNNQSIKTETSSIEPISVKLEQSDHQSSNQTIKHETNQSSKQPVNRLKQLAIQAVQQIGRELGELKGTERIIKRKITGRERRLEALRSEIAAMNTKGPSAQQSFIQLTAHTKDLTDELSEIKSMISQLNNITSQMLLEPPNHRKKAKEKTKNQSNEQKLDQLNEEMELIHSTSDELLGQASNDHDLTQTIDLLRTELYQVKSINGLNNDAIRVYKQEIEDKKRQVDELKRLMEQIEAGDSTVSQLHAQTKDLTSQLESSNKEIQQLQKHTRNLTRSLENYKNQMSKIKAKKTN